MQLIEDLKAYRKEKHLTQESLSRILGVSFTTLNRWLRDKNEPSQLAIEKIEQLLKKK